MLLEAIILEHIWVPPLYNCFNRRRQLAPLFCTIKTTGSNTAFDLFVDGQYNDTTITAGTTIDMLAEPWQHWPGRLFLRWPVLEGGLLSGSIDEFRY